MKRPSTGAREPTIVHVAEAAGVSKSTVSNVLRGFDGVADDTRARVESVMKELGYRPNALARQFVSQRTTIFGVLVGDLDNPFYAEIAKRVERYAFANGYTPMFCNIEGEPDFAVSRVESLVEQRVAGVVFLAFFGRSPDIRAMLHERVPVVFAGLREDWGDSVSVSDPGGAALATRHLVELGHRRIAYVTSRHVEPRASRARYGGYRRELRRAGLPAIPAIQWDPDSGRPTIGGRATDLLEQFGGDDPVTAVFCSNDLQAIALLDFADQHGIGVPDDLSIVGFDNVGLAGLERISLTTVAQPLDEMARLAVGTLVDRLEGRVSGAARHVVVDASLVVRRSTGPRPGAPARA